MQLLIKLRDRNFSVAQFRNTNLQKKNTLCVIIILRTSYISVHAYKKWNISLYRQVKIVWVADSYHSIFFIAFHKVVYTISSLEETKG